MANNPVFSVTETGAVGATSYCWVEEHAGDFFMYGNEIGCMSGPCRSAFWAIRAARGFQFGMDYMAVEASIHPDELRRILSSPSFAWSRVSSLTINGATVQEMTIDEIMRVYCHRVAA